MGQIGGVLTDLVLHTLRREALQLTGRTTQDHGSWKDEQVDTVMAMPIHILMAKIILGTLRTQGVIITSLLRQNDVATSF